MNAAAAAVTETTGLFYLLSVTQENNYAISYFVNLKVLQDY
jgi:hypothetical protein